MKNEYRSPLVDRYASPEMVQLFSAEKRYSTWRQVWIALAKAQKDLGLPISEEMLQEMEAARATFDWEHIDEYERVFKHDVMAHLHAFGDLCPLAKPTMHLGATSCLITDNADLLLLKEGLQVLFEKLCCVLEALGNKAKEYAALPCIGYTHFQPAQPTTFGKRITLWLQDLYWDALELKRVIAELPFLGAKGTTGTQASFLALLGDKSAVTKLDTLLADYLGFSNRSLPISGQTYSRKIDTKILQTLASNAASLHKLATDLRLLSHTGEASEGFTDSQVGSSAMPYKQNPIRAERLCSLSRFIISLTESSYYTTATQWLERSLDDSAIRRITLPEAFLATDANLILAYYLARNMLPNTEEQANRLEHYLPRLLTENILMECVKKGGDRQALHEKLRKLSRKQLSKEELFNEISLDEDFPLGAAELTQVSEMSLTGLAEEQVLRFLQDELYPFLNNEQYSLSAIEKPTI